MEEDTTRTSDCQTLSLVELCDTDFKMGIEPSIFLPSEISTKISESEQHHNGSHSQGIMWQPLHSRKKQQGHIMLLSTSFNRNGISKSHLVDTSTQTCHFESTATKPQTTKKAEKTDEEVKNECKECIIPRCNIKEDIDDNSTKIYQIKCLESQILLISEALQYHMPEKLIKREQLLLCSKHFVTYPVNVGRRSKVSKTSTIDLVPTVSNRPRRKPKPNRAYDWAEVDLPRIHPESSEQQKYCEIDEEPVYYKTTKSRGRKRKHCSSKQKYSCNKILREDGIFFKKSDSQECHPEVYHSNVYLLKVLGKSSDKKRMVCDTSVQCSFSSAGESNLLPHHDGSTAIDWKRLIESLSIILEELGSEVACHPRISACLNSYLKGLDDQANWHQTQNPVITILRALAYGIISPTDKSNNIYVVSEQTDEEELEIRIQDASQTMGGPISSVKGSSISQYQYQKNPEQLHMDVHDIHNSSNHIEQNTYVKDGENSNEEIYSYETETANNQILRTFTDNESNKKKRLRMSLSQKKDLCLLKEEYPTITNENIGRVFQDQWGFTVSKSTVRDILKEKDRWLAVTAKDIEADIKIPKHKTITPWIRQKLCQYKNENPQIAIGELVLWAKDNLDMILDDSIAQEILRFDEMWKNLISHTSDSTNNAQNQEKINDFHGADINKGKLLKVSIKQKQELCLLKDEYPNIPFGKLGKIFHDEWGFTISKTAAREIYRDRDKWLSSNPQNTCRTRSKPPSTISAEQKMALCQLHEEFPFITREEIAKIFFLEWGIDMSLSTISGILKDRTKWLQFDED